MLMSELMKVWLPVCNKSENDGVDRNIFQDLTTSILNYFPHLKNYINCLRPKRELDLLTLAS